MCAVSMIYDYGNKMPDLFWFQQQNWEQYKKLIEAAKEFDKVTKQPDCKDPNKEKILKKISKIRKKAKSTSSRKNETKSI